MTLSRAVVAGALGGRADWISSTVPSSPLAHKNVLDSIGSGKYFRIACSNNLQISSASADRARLFFTFVLLHANGGDDAEGNE